MTNPGDSSSKVIIIGAGPGGLTAAYQLCKLGIPSLVVEKDSQVGGLSRTVRSGGYHFDIGGHRFFTKVPAVDELWHEILSDEDFLKRSRLSRIHYNKKFFDYPLRPSNALLGLGLWTSFLVFLSYFRAWLFPIRNEKTFEDWVSNRFGKKLFNIFFKTYTEKVWGIPCSALSKEWAAQRIRGLSMLSVVKNALLSKQKAKKDVVKTLIDSFHYPKQGPGMMWEAAASKVQSNGGELRMNCSVERMIWEGSRVTAVELRADGKTEKVVGSHFISTMPVRELIQKLHPRVPEDIREAASLLNYRDFLTVALVVNKPHLFPDNWIYIHDPQVKVGRIQNFKNWSPFMVADPNKTCLGLEYFCFEGDGLWSMSDEALISQAKAEIEILGLGRAVDVERGVVVRAPKAYPVYDHVYADALRILRTFLGQLENLYPIGRNGMHKYNNQDHSMLTAMLAVENIKGAQYDIWGVNADQDYHEEISADPHARNADFRSLASTQPMVPMPADSASPALAIIRRAFGRIHEKGFGAALGTVMALYTFLGIGWVLVSREEELVPALQLLSHFFIGFTVDWPGAVVGSLYGFVLGFILGWSMAFIRNKSLDLYLYLIKLREESRSLEL